MPTAWEPCPGKVNAAVINAPEWPLDRSWGRPEIAKVGPKDTAKACYVKPPPVPARPARIGRIVSLSLAIAPKILINRASADPGRELNGRSQQSHLFGDVDVAGPVGPSSRASAF
jgi:hypothetical protein